MKRLGLMILLLSGGALAQAPQHHSAVRGLASTLEIDYAPTLRARAAQLPVSPIAIRVSRASEARQRIEFIGAKPGEYDLRDYLEREDGQPLTDLAPLTVTVVSQLPADHGTDLYDAGAARFEWQAYYREFMIAAVILWAAVPIAYFIYRATRKPQPVAAAPAAPRILTLEDHLRDALDRAALRPLSVEERGQLEMLVFRYFGEHTGEVASTEHRARAATLDEMHAMLRRVRAHPETRDLVAAIERWLHAQGSGDGERATAAAALGELRRSRLAARQVQAGSALAGGPQETAR